MSYEAKFNKLELNIPDQFVNVKFFLNLVNSDNKNALAFFSAPDSAFNAITGVLITIVCMKDFSEEFIADTEKMFYYASKALANFSELSYEKTQQFAESMSYQFFE